MKPQIMKPVDKALWFIESHFAREIALDDIADKAGASRYYLSRAFQAATGYSVIGYLRARRLSEAARALSQNPADILGVALDAGYGSHEAFTRAFRDLFGETPEQVRGRRSLDHLSLVEPLRMDKIAFVPLHGPRFEQAQAKLIAGFAERFQCENAAGIPALWQRFQPHIGHLPHEVAHATYGICYNTDDAGNMDYIAGSEVTDYSDLPAEFQRLRVAAQRYAVFTHKDHVTTIRSTMHTIFSEWLPSSGHRLADAPVLERYDGRFNPRTGMGGFEIWVPLKD
jgi:AraC family transcriptional regulator